MKGILILEPQECKGKCDFIMAHPYASKGFAAKFPEHKNLIINAQIAINNAYGGDADYLQIFDYIKEGRIDTFFVIHDEAENITFLLPEEY